MAPGNSTRTLRSAKDFPLWLHKPSGYWCRKVRGRRFYFSKDKDEALRLWLDQKDDLLAGRQPRKIDENAITTKRCVNEFLTSKQAKLDTGDLSHRHFNDLYATCEFVLMHFGKERLATDLAPADFRQLRVKLAKKFGPAGEARWNRNIRQLFSYAYKNGLIEQPIRYGSEFEPPSQRKHRAARNEKNRLFTPSEIRTILDVASVPMRAMVLLGLNAGLGNTDVAFLETKHVDLDAAWLDYARRRTSISRRCKLWGETCQAIRSALEQRPRHKEAKHAGIIFITQRGSPWGSLELPQSAVSTAQLALLSPRVGYPETRNASEFPW